jgi:hypothetical protein
MGDTIDTIQAMIDCLEFWKAGSRVNESTHFMDDQNDKILIRIFDLYTNQRTECRSLFQNPLEN